MQTSEIRQKFLSFFESKGHSVVPSSSLIPANDPSLLFTNAGMVQFKDVFTGHETRPYTRATSSQRCVRAGGKHNDLENVGYTARHHTFFEMLGNFSFGDYFKRDAIVYAWELLTEVFGLPADKLWVTVYADDNEAYDIWHQEIGIPAERLVRIGDNLGAPYASDNFWQMADTGPCGPSSEIFYDHGPDVWGGPPGSPDEDGDRYIEIWNLVFMQYDRDASGKLNPLPKPCVDTGMGLERIAAVLQHVNSNYDIDLFQALIKAAARETNTNNLADNSLKVIADHIRACCFLVVDGVIPGNEGRGYVLRRIIRRALRHGHKLGQENAFFYRLVNDVVQQMGGAYPELKNNQQRLEQVLKQEEDRFRETLSHGIKILEEALAKLPKDGVLDGQTLFVLYDTYGFPVDLTADICRERQIEVDLEGFDQAMAKQREQARAAGKFKSAESLSYDGVETRFEGYSQLKATGAVTALYVDGVAVDTVAEGQEAVVVLDVTPFYAESGGQVGDSGQLLGPDLVFDVADTQKLQESVHGHHGTLRQGKLQLGDRVEAVVDAETRARTIRNHSATHLMHTALRKVLGNHVQQRGSLVDAHRTRFDFTHDSPLKPEQITQIEHLVNQEILNNTPVAAQLMAYDDAIKGGAIALFGEKYGDDVRVLDIGFSRELCGGTHVQATGDIGLFKIVSESGISAGVRRLEAVTGLGAIEWVQQAEQQLEDAAAVLKTQPALLSERIEQLQQQQRELERELQQLKNRMASSAGKDLAQQAQALPGGAQLVLATLGPTEAKVLRGLADQLKDQLGSAVVLLAAVDGDKISLVAGVTADLTDIIKAGDLVRHVATAVGGKGGGRPDMAMGGGSKPEALSATLKQTASWIDEKFQVTT